MRRAIATVSMSGILREKLEAAAAARFDAVELFEPDFIAFRGTPREVRRIADDLGIAVDLYQSLADYEGVPGPVFQRTLERAERKFDVLEALGVPTFGVTATASAQSDPALVADQLHTLAERAARRNVRVAFSAPTARWADAWSIVQQANHPHLGLLLDSFYTLQAETPELAGMQSIPGNRVFFVKIADGQRARGDGAESCWRRTFPAQGELDVAGFLEHVLLSGYAGTVSVESLSDIFRAIPNRRAGTDAMRSLLFLESQVRQRLERNASDTTPATVPMRILNTVSLFDPPDPSPLKGFAFLEFGVDGDTSLRLGSALQQLGFARFGRHRTKDVTLYRQGDIHFVLNAEGSDARKRFAEHGASLSCLGLLAESPLQAATRGSALLSTRQDSRRAGQELELPTLVAPGGTIVQFVSAQDQSVETDFIAEPSAEAVSPCGLKVVDHVAMGLTLEQLDTWVLFTTAVLGLTPAAGVDIAVPFGRIRSRGVSNENRHLCIVLNAAASHAPARGGWASESARRGGDVDYIALGCDDIFDTVERLRANGVAFVPLSSNYYDDLVARVSLDPSVVDRMRALDIVYDNTGGGEYFQAYTEAFEDRFHFQITQRQNYDGYGAVNLPVHVALVEQLRQAREWLATFL
jgi:4-hydroxyphenylpyruvate dioxygenase